MTEPRTILLVDDEPDMLEVIRLNFEREGYHVVTERRGDAALETARARAPDLVVLDVMMPEVDGYEVARRLRADAQTKHVPIVMLTAKADEPSEFAGFKAGVDDYITKPASMRVLLARVATVLARASQRSGDGKTPVLEMGPIRLDLDHHLAFVAGEEVDLTLTETKLLTALLSADGKVLSRPSLITRAMGPGVTVTERTIDVHVTSIRKKLGEHAGMIRTVRGVGYRIVVPDRVSE